MVVVLLLDLIEKMPAQLSGCGLERTFLFLLMAAHITRSQITREVEGVSQVGHPERVGARSRTSKGMIKMGHS